MCLVTIAGVILAMSAFWKRWSPATVTSYAEAC